jgi:hypothetical protein
MSGNHNSGRKPKVRAVPTGAPRLDKSVDSIERHARWVMQNLLAGKLDPVLALEATQVHRSLLRAASQKYSEREMEELRAMVAEAKAAQEELRAQAVAARFGQGGSADDGVLGEWKADADGVLRPVKPA